MLMGYMGASAHQTTCFVATETHLKACYASASEHISMYSIARRGGQFQWELDPIIYSTDVHYMSLRLYRTRHP